MDQLTDYQLIRKYLKGDESSLEVLVQKYMSHIYGFLFKYVKDEAVAQDLTQEVFLKVWKNLKKIEKNKNFKSWLYTVAKNTALDYIKKKKAVPLSYFEDETGKNVLTERLTDKGRSPSQLYELKENKAVFLSAIENLSIKYKTVLSLYYYEYLNFREIAEKLKKPINTIKSRHRRGLVLLGKSIKSY